MIDFKRGHPNSDLVPADAMKQILHLITEADEDHHQGDLLSHLNYPNAKNDNGDPELLQELRTFLDEQTRFDDTGSAQICKIDTIRSNNDNISNTENHFFMTHGVSHAIDILCGTLTERGDVVGMESPTYFLVAHVFQQHGLKMQSLPMMMNGCNKVGQMDVKRFADMLQSGEMVPPRLIYTIPTNHNPTGATIPVEDRILLAELSEQYGFYVIADEVYHLLDWKDPGLRPARMATFNNSPNGYCISVSSFTKIFAPGVRCGWIEGPKRVIQQLSNYGYIVSQGGCLPFMGHVMRVALQNGICTTVLNKLRQAYQERAQLLCRILDTCPDITITVRPTGGYFLWIQLPCDATTFSTFTEKRGVKILPGTICDPFSNESVHNCARLCFADLSLPDLEKGALALIRMLSDYRGESVEGNNELGNT